MELGFPANSTSSSSHCDVENSQSRSESPDLEGFDDEEGTSASQIFDDGVQPSTSQNANARVYYRIGKEIIPYCAILDVPPEKVTLGDFKRVFSRPNYKFFCKVPSPDSAISSEVKVEISRDDELLLRSVRGQYELFLENYEENSVSDDSPDFTVEQPEVLKLSNTNLGSKAVCRHSIRGVNRTVTSSETGTYATESFYPIANKNARLSRKRNRVSSLAVRASYRSPGCKDSAFGSGTEVRINSEDDEGVSTSTDVTSVSRQKPNAYRKRCNRKKFRVPSQSSFYTSILENSLSMDVITVTLNLDTVQCLGISIVGQSSLKGDNGIYVANVMKGGAIALDGRIAPGDMIIQVNDIALDNFTNDQAVDALKDLVSRKGLIKLTVAKMWDGRPRSHFSVFRHDEEPVRPIDLNAWVQHTNAMRGLVTATASYTREVAASSCISPLDSENSDFREKVRLRLSSKADRMNIVQLMALPGSGLKLKDRVWLKMVIPDSFLGSNLVSWLVDHVDGIEDRKQARDFANLLLEEKLITHFVEKAHFNEKCYYGFGPQKGNDLRNLDAMSRNHSSANNQSLNISVIGSSSVIQHQSPTKRQNY